jgi:hypothetical protein
MMMERGEPVAKRARAPSGVPLGLDRFVPWRGVRALVWRHLTPEDREVARCAMNTRRVPEHLDKIVVYCGRNNFMALWTWTRRCGRVTTFTDNQMAAHAAARRGHAAMCIAIIECFGRCPNLDSVAYGAGRGGNLALVQAILARGLLEHALMTARAAAFEGAAEGGHIHAMEWLWAEGVSSLPRHHSIVESAARKDRLEAVLWLVSHGYEFGAHAAEYAAMGGSVRILQWASLNDTHMDRHSVMQCAVEGGHLNAVKWAVAEFGNVLWIGAQHYACSRAAVHPNHDMLQYLRDELKFAWDERTCASAAQHGQLETLKWAHTHGCPWNEETCASAAGAGHLGVLQWARAQGCPWDCGRVLEIAQQASAYNVWRWAHAQ